MFYHHHFEVKIWLNKQMVPSGKLTARPWKSPSFLVNTIKMVDFPASYVSFREGKISQKLMLSQVFLRKMVFKFPSHRDWFVSTPPPTTS